jgi:dihydroflavonol-4-reductase
MKVFVTGAHGFIGARVTRALHTRGHELRCLVRETSDTSRIDDLPWERVVGGVRDPGTMLDGMRGCEACIHLAAVSSWEAIRSDALRPTIVEGTRHLLDVAVRAGIRRVIHVSSIVAINGTRTPEISDESSAFTLAKRGLLYAEAKREAEAIAREHAARGPLEVVIVNPGETYGPDDRAMVTAGNLRDILCSWPVVGCRGGTSIAHVDDVAEGMVLALERGRSGERYVLGGDNVSIPELIALTLDIAGSRKPVLILPSRLLQAIVRALAWCRLPTPVMPDVLDYATLYFRPAREVLEPTITWLYDAGHVPRRGALPKRNE